jgi:drug/metabolite transporter (DMT)-like permease
MITHSMTAVQIAFLQFVSTGTLALIAAVAFEDMRFNPTASMLLSVGYLTVFATIITTSGQAHFQKETTPTRAVIIFTIEPVWASLFAFMILGEQLDTLGILGAGLIIAGVLVSQLSDNVPILGRSIIPSQT